MSRVLIILSCFLPTLSLKVVKAGTPLIELTTSDKQHQGKVLFHDQSACVLAERDGRLAVFQLNDVVAFRKVCSRFRPRSVIDVRGQLRQEYKGRMEVTAKGQYVVCAARGKSKEYANILDEVYSDFLTYFSRRKFRLEKPEFPLVVIVFPTQQEFVQYASQERQSIPPTLRGYYYTMSNRVALFEAEQVTLRDTFPAERSFVFHSVGQNDTPSLTGYDPALFGTIEAGLRETLIHEATHQLAFNCGLHSRVGENPRWVTEGLAMLFEKDARRNGSRSRSLKDRVNRERYLRFMGYAHSQRSKKGALEAFIRSDDAFTTRPLDAYAEAWALSFFLIETRPAKYSEFLRMTGSRETTRSYAPEERLSDFQSIFGKNLDWLDGQFLQFMNRIDRP